MALLGNSYHQKKLSKTDVYYRLAFPTMWLELFLPALKVQGRTRAAEIEVWDELSQKLRSFVCTIRDGKHPKPVLTRGWRGFVKENKIKVGDKIIFYKQVDDHHRAHFRIDVERANIDIESAATGTGISVVSLGISDEKSTTIGMDTVDTTLRLSLN